MDGSKEPAALLENVNVPVGGGKLLEFASVAVHEAWVEIGMAFGAQVTAIDPAEVSMMSKEPEPLAWSESPG